MAGVLVGMEGAPRRVVNVINKLVQLVALGVGEQARLLVAARVVDVHCCRRALFTANS